MKLAHPFVRLPFHFDSPRLAQEVSQLPESAWMAHPNRVSGNSAVPLISKDGADNDDFSGVMQTTKHLAQCPYTRQAMASFSQVLGRSRFMKLGAGAEVSAHVDFNYHWYHRVRIHIPVITNEQVIFYCGDQQRHMRAGECWIFDSWRRHNVINNSDQDRVHLVIDTAGSSEFWRMVEKMQSQEHQLEIRSVAFSSSAVVDLQTEKYNIAPVMAPGELEAIADDLIADFSANPNNPKQRVEQYRLLLTDLAKDWRETFHLYGFQKEGLERYRFLLNRTVQQMDPNRRALVTASNDVGVNPIIVQRILRAALAPDDTEF